MRILKQSANSAMNASVVLIAMVTIISIMSGFKPLWAVNVGILLVSSLEATRLSMSRDALNARFDKGAGQVISNRNMLGLFAIAPFILFLPFTVKLVLISAAALFSLYEIVKHTRNP